MVVEVMNAINTSLDNSKPFNLKPDRYTATATHTSHALTSQNMRPA